MVPSKRVVAAVLGLALLAGGLAAAPGATATDPTTIMFGAYPRYRGTETKRQAVLNLEKAIGRPLAAVRVFKLWDHSFPDGYDTWLRDSGHMLFLSVKTKRTNGTYVSWRGIADAQPGSTLYSQIASWADRVKAFGAPMVFIFNHEPEAKSSRGSGNNVDYIDAWRKVVTVFGDRGVTNAKFVWTMTDYSFWVQDQRSAPLWYPGDEWVDGIAADAYNWYECRVTIKNRWKTLEEIVAPMLAFGAAHPDEQLMLTEWASSEDPAAAGRKAGWIQDVQALFQQPGWDRFTAVLYFHTQDGYYTNCRWWVDTSSSSLTAFKTMATDPYYAATTLP